MATTALSTSFPTLLDHITRMDPNGAIAPIVELLSKQNAVLGDAVFQEGNLPTGHKFTSRVALPSIARRRFNEGVAPQKSKTAQVTEATTMLEAFSAVDVDEADLNGNTAAFRASEDVAFLEAFNQKAEAELIYGSSATDPSDMTGLIPRFDSTSGQGGSQIVLHTDSASGSDQTSMLLVGWGPQSVFGIFPKGSKGGLSNRDMGKQLWDPNNDGSKFLAWVNNWNWKLGLVVKDYRQVAVIRNIDTGSGLAATGNALIQSAIKAYHKIKNPGAAKLAWYCNRDVATYLHLQALDSTKNSTLSIENVAGRPVTKLLGIPIGVSDAITSTEAAIS